VLHRVDSCLNSKSLSFQDVKTLFRFTAFLLICASFVSARAVVLLDEPFNYSDGPLVTVSGGVWSTHSGVTGEVGVVSGHVDLRVPDTEDVNALLLGQPYPASTNIWLYASFTVNVSVLPSAGGTYFAHFKGTGNTIQRAKVFALTSGAGTGQYRVGLANAANSAAIATATSMNTNADYRIYLRYVVSNATATLWVDPTSEVSPSITATAIVPTPGTITSFALRQDIGIGVVAFDDLRVGTSFVDVFQAPITNPPTITQQPANTATVEGGIATFSVTATGTEPLGYQWKFYNTNLPGATATNLVLNNVTTNQAGLYSVTVSNAVGTTNSATATLTVIGPSSSGTITLVHYNVKGNFATNWTTGGPQLQAIGRQLAYLNPDVITFNEIPYAHTDEMTNFINVFLPSYFMATNSGRPVDVIRSVIMSRYPITRSQAWLTDASLTNFGYAGTYTRDLFEAEITVPGATEPLHVFTTHLKSAEDGDAQDRRAAEANCVSNFFVTTFIPSNGYRPYVLTGDLNEDIDLPMSHNNQPIQHLTALATGLKLTTPLNPFTSSRFTHSIQGSLDARFDYIMPAGVLSSNIVASQVFRTDLLPPPLPLNLNSNDDIVASDHLPMVMVFNYPDPTLRLTLAVSNGNSIVSWPALVGRKFRVDTSTNLTTWTVIASNLVALAPTYTFTTNVNASARFFRVYRTP